MMDCEFWLMRVKTPCFCEKRRDNLEFFVIVFSGSYCNLFVSYILNELTIYENFEISKLLTTLDTFDNGKSYVERLIDLSMRNIRLSENIFFVKLLLRLAERRSHV